MARIRDTEAVRRRPSSCTVVRSSESWRRLRGGHVEEAHRSRPVLVHRERHRLARGARGLLLHHRGLAQPVDVGEVGPRLPGTPAAPCRDSPRPSRRSWRAPNRPPRRARRSRGCVPASPTPRLQKASMSVIRRVSESLATPPDALRPSVGKVRGLATPICALAAAMRRSAAAMSGRRSSSVEGRPARNLRDARRERARARW